jgi:hypothetical protein
MSGAGELPRAGRRGTGGCTAGRRKGGDGGRRARGDLTEGGRGRGDPEDFGFRSSRFVVPSATGFPASRVRRMGRLPRPPRRDSA